MAWQTSLQEPRSILTASLALEGATSFALKVCGLTKDKVLIVNLPGHPNAVRQSSFGAAIPVRPLQLGPATSAPSSLEATVESLQLVARCCDGEDLARLAQGNRRFWRQLSDQEVLDRAALVCPGASAGWLRRAGLCEWRDATLGSAGWTFALHQAHGRSCVHDCVAVSTPGGALALVHLAADFTVLKEEALCTSGRCLDFTLCWGPHGEYVAFTAVTESQNTALVITPTKSMRRPPLVIPLIPFLTPYYLCPSPCGTRLAFLGSVKNQQVLMVADLSPLLISLPQAVARVKCLGSAAPLYFDWAPHAPELLAVCHEKKLVRLVAELPVGQRPSLREPTEAGDSGQRIERC
eukprot:g17843.t1